MRADRQYHNRPLPHTLHRQSSDFTQKRTEQFGIGERHTDVDLFVSGAFEFFFTYSTAEGEEKRVDGCFVVEPELSGTSVYAGNVALLLSCFFRMGAVL